MADAMISVVLERAAAILVDQIRYEVNLVRGVENEVLDLSGKLETIRNVLDDAEKRRVKEGSVKKWLKKLEDEAYEMDDILDEWNYALHKHKVELAAIASAMRKVCCFIIPSSSLLSFKKVVVRRDTAMKIQNVKATLDQILKEKDEFSFVMSLPPSDLVPKPPRVQSTSSIELEKVYGHNIDRNKEDIVRKLMVNNGDSQLVLSIVGMGGLGKTTLAQLVYNDTQVKMCFNLRIWICVSDPFDVDGIARGIVNSVGKETIPPDTDQLELILEKLRDSILGKKFLLVLDDVWTEKSEEWEPLKNILKHGAPGCKIMVTTRKEGVAKMMGTFDNDICRPQQLSDEECWSLLRLISHSGRSEEERGKFDDVGKKIAIKCKGLPLAAKVLGSLLQCKRSLEEWENVLESEIWRLEKAEVDLFPHLLLSYNELSHSLKRCFTYCAVYPKDYRINAKSLVEEWMALGYLGSIAGKNGAEVKGNDYFNNLAMRSLFQEFERKSGELSEEIEWCKMYDIVHDFAKFLRKNNDRVLEASERTMKKACGIHDPLLISQLQEYRSLFWDENYLPTLCDCVSSLRVLRFKENLKGPPRGMEKLIHLRMLELSGTKLSKEEVKMICSFYFLQTLLLESCSLEEIPSEIGNLVHLRHLHLKENNDVAELPESMCSLVELQILNIQGCWKLSIPEWIEKLENLQHLFIEDAMISRYMPQGVGELRRLRTLSSAFHAGDYYNKLGLLKNLNRLGSLQLHMYIRSTSALEKLAEGAREVEMRSKIHIQTLELQFIVENRREEWWSTSPSSLLWMDVIEALEPHLNLRKLQIWWYEGSRLPNWITSPLNLVKEIILIALSELTALPPMGKLPFLKLLHMKKLLNMKFVGREFLGFESSSSSSSSSWTKDGFVSFPKLKKLVFDDFPEWSEWEDLTAEEEESNLLSIMPCLEELHIASCDGLKKLPRRLLLKASTSLKSFYLYESPQLIESYRDGEDGSPWRYMFRNNPRLVFHLYF